MRYTEQPVMTCCLITSHIGWQAAHPEPWRDWIPEQVIRIVYVQTTQWAPAHTAKSKQLLLPPMRRRFRPISAQQQQKTLSQWNGQHRWERTAMMWSLEIKSTMWQVHQLQLWDCLLIQITLIVYRLKIQEEPAVILLREQSGHCWEYLPMLQLRLKQILSP